MVGLSVGTVGRSTKRAIRAAAGNLNHDLPTHMGNRNALRVGPPSTYSMVQVMSRVKFDTSSIPDWAILPDWARLEILQNTVSELYEDRDAQRLRADTAEAERDSWKGMREQSRARNSKLRKKLSAAEQRIAELELPAARWNAFTNCSRIRFFGWAGYEEKDPYGNSPGNYRHFGGEFWTVHDAPPRDFSAKETAHRILNGFADAAIDAALNPNPEAESHEIAREALKMENQRIAPARFKCLACGAYHEGSPNLPCPKMTPYSGNKP